MKKLLKIDKIKYWTIEENAFGHNLFLLGFELAGGLTLITVGILISLCLIPVWIADGYAWYYGFIPFGIMPLVPLTIWGFNFFKRWFKVLREK